MGTEWKTQIVVNVGAMPMLAQLVAVPAVEAVGTQSIALQKWEPVRHYHQG